MNTKLKNKIRIKLKAYDHEILKKSCESIINTVDVKDTESTYVNRYLHF